MEDSGQVPRAVVANWWSIRSKRLATAALEHLRTLEEAVLCVWAGESKEEDERVCVHPLSVSGGGDPD